MAQLTGNTNNLSLTMNAFTTQTPGHATVMNQVWQQMLDNDAFNDAQITALRRLVQGYESRIAGLEARCTALETRCSTLETAVKELQLASPSVTNPTPVTETPAPEPSNNYQVTADFTIDVTNGHQIHGGENFSYGSAKLSATASTNAPGATITSYDWTIKIGDTIIQRDTGQTIYCQNQDGVSAKATLVVTDSAGTTATVTHAFITAVDGNR